MLPNPMYIGALPLSRNSARSSGGEYDLLSKNKNPVISILFFQSSGFGIKAELQQYKNGTRRRSIAVAPEAAVRGWRLRRFLRKRLIPRPSLLASSIWSAPAYQPRQRGHSPLPCQTVGQSISQVVPQPLRRVVVYNIDQRLWKFGGG